MSSDQEGYNSDEENESDRKSYVMNSSKKSEKSFSYHQNYTNISQMHCKVCDVYSNGWQSLEQHIAGKRHAENVHFQKGGTFNKRKNLESCTYQEYNYKKRKLTEETNEKKNIVGLDYVLVIHKQGKSVFQCFLCDTHTTYQNGKQLADHVLGDEHQRAYLEQHGKGLIKIKRLKSKKPGKGALEESIEQMLLKPNKKNKLERNSLRKYDSSCYKKSAKTIRKRPEHPFLKRILEQVVNHNQRCDSKVVPKKRSSSATSESISLTPTNQTSSEICKQSPKSESSQSSVIFLSDEEGCDDQVVSTETAVPHLFPLEKNLETVDVFNLVLIKLKNIQWPELNLLKEAVEKSTILIKEFEEKFLNTTVQEATKCKCLPLVPYSEMISPTSDIPQDLPLPLAPELESTGSKQLDKISSQIKELQMGKMMLEKDIVQKEADVRIKNEELKNAQNELYALETLIKHLETQKGEAHKWLNDLNKQESIPFINEVEEENSTGTDEILVQEKKVVENIPFINEENSTKTNESTEESVLSNLPSTEEIYNILRNIQSIDNHLIS